MAFAITKKVESNVHWFRMKPNPMPDPSNAKEMASWIEQVRNAAFMCGARHDEISQVEADLIARSLKSTNNDDEAEKLAQIIFDASPDRFMRVQQCMDAARAIIAARMSPK